MAGKCDVCAGKVPKDKKKESDVSVRGSGCAGQVEQGSEHCCGQTPLWCTQINYKEK
jgi:hypothetical protein